MERKARTAHGQRIVGILEILRCNPYSQVYKMRNKSEFKYKTSKDTDTRNIAIAQLHALL